MANTIRIKDPAGVVGTRLQPRKKHRRFDVVWNPSRGGTNQGGRWEVVESNVVVVHEVPGTTKRDAVRYARMMARDERADDPTQVFTHDNAGRIGTGGNAEASFRCDSKRRRG